jgi:hypothetical protein
MKPVRITKLAQTEIDAAANWFERRREGLGSQFYQRVDEAAEKIGINPRRLPKTLQRHAPCQPGAIQGMGPVLPRSGRWINRDRLYERKTAPIIETRESVWRNSNKT